MRPVIHSTKHYVQISRSSVLTVALNSEDIVLAVKTANKDAVDEVEEGAIVKAVFIELWILDEGNDGSFVITLGKYPGGVNALTFAGANGLGNYSNKKNLLYVSQGLTPNDGITSPVAVLRQWIKIPKSKQRFGLDDKLRLTISSNGLNSISYCGFATYKEYT